MDAYGDRRDRSDEQIPPRPERDITENGELKQGARADIGKRDHGQEQELPTHARTQYRGTDTRARRIAQALELRRHQGRDDKGHEHRQSREGRVHGGDGLEGRAQIGSRHERGEHCVGREPTQ